jgi:hypothetical protein
MFVFDVHQSWYAAAHRVSKQLKRIGCASLGLQPARSVRRIRLRCDLPTTMRSRGVSMRSSNVPFSEADCKWSGIYTLARIVINIS